MLTLLRYGLTVARATVVGTLLLTVATSAATGALAYLLGRVVGRISTGGLVGGPGAGDLWLLAALAATVLANGVLPIAVAAGVFDAGNRVNEDVGVRLIDPLLAPPGIAHLEDHQVADEQMRARGKLGFAVGLGVQAALRLAGTRLAALGAAALLGLVFSPWVAAGVLLSTWLVERHVSRIIVNEFEAWHRATGGHRRADYIFGLAMHDAVKELRVFGLADFLRDRYVRDWDSAMAPQWRARRRAIASSLAVLGLHLGVFGAAVVLVTRAATQTLPIADMATAIAAVMTVGMAHNGTAVAETARGVAAYRSMRRLPAVVADRHPLPLGRTVATAGWPGTAIRFEGVWFRYPGSTVDVLRGLDLEITAGTSVALVGVNGAGKTTLVKLLAGCYRPTSGRITVDGTDLSTLDAEALAAWQRRIAAIMQRFIRFPFTAAENVQLGGDADRRGLAEVAGQAGLAGAVERLPLGWDTVLEPSLPSGAELSGGQWQRLALARALYAVRGGARMLVLDEPAAALDVRAEAELVDRYLDLTAGVTSLIISHRFSVVRGAARICVLDAGRIVEEGRHEDLVRAGGRYATLFALQARRYAATGERDG